MNRPCCCNSRPGWIVSALAVVLLLVPSVSSAQTDVEQLGRRWGVTPPAAYYEMLNRNPDAFRFSATGGWKVRAEAVRERRNAARSSGDQAALAGGPFAQAALSGDLNVPVLMALYQSSDSAGIMGFADSATMASRLFGTNVAPPYSVHSYYDEISNGALSVNGSIVNWIRVPGDNATYDQGCNGIFCGGGGAPGIAALILDLVTAADPSVDFGLFDNDGPDNLPNSGDDDGFVDALVIIHPTIDGSCGPQDTNKNIWAHRWTYNSASQGAGPLATGDAASGGGVILVNDYIIQGGQGGDTGCTANQPQAMGVVSHELGHALGLPDLYDTGGATEGIGEWGLMGSGNWHVPTSPTHMTAWSKGQLGWITEVLISTDTVLSIGPIQTADTSYILPVPNTSEYFELSNRQAIGSDVGMLQGSRPLNTGLLIWHTDSVIMQARSPSNSVNAGTIHALALEQADGLDNLASDTDQNRGDAGDPFPGTTNNTSFSFNTTPSSARNDGVGSFVTVDSIIEESDMRVTARISFQRPTIVSLTHGRNVCSHCGQFYADFTAQGDTIPEEFVGFFSAGAAVTLGIDSVQLRDDNRRRFTWLSWSDGGARTHDLLASGAGDSVIGQMKAEFLVSVVVDGQGTVTSPELATLNVGTDSSGSEFTEEFTSINLVAAPATGQVFERWSTGVGDVLSDTLTMSNLTAPVDANALFSPLLTITSTGVADGTLGFAYSDSLTADGGRDTFSWSSTGGLFPTGVSMASSGLISGTPRESGTFTVNVMVSSGVQNQEMAITMTVGQPTLVTANVIAAILDTGQSLSAEELNFLDLQGNGNGSFDVGDFVAWVDQNNISVSAAVMNEILSRAGLEGGNDR